MTAQVSVIVPVRNGERYLGAAIESILKQSYAPSEVIVVDNGSVDGSAAVAQRFGPPVQVLTEPVPGPAQARNFGIRAASGDFIAFLDADDLWDPLKLEHQISIMLQQPEVDLVFANMREFISPDLTDAQQANMSPRADDYRGMCASTLLARARAFQIAGAMPQIPIGEFVAWYGLAQTAGLKSHLIPEVLVKRRIHLTNMSRRTRDEQAGYLKAAKIVLDARRAERRQGE